MNGLYGYPTSGAALADFGRLYSNSLASFGGLGVSEDELKVTLWKVMKGEMYTTLKNIEDENKAFLARWDAAQVVINGLPAGALKQQAQAKAAQAMQVFLQGRAKFVEARSKYNDLVVEIRTRTANLWKPAYLSDFGALPVVAPAIVDTLIGVGVIAALIAGIIVAVNLALSGLTGSKNIINDLENLLRGAGASAKDLGQAAIDAAKAAEKATETALKTALVVGLAVGGWALFKWWQGRRGSRSVSIPISVTPQLDLKPVSGSVV